MTSARTNDQPTTRTANVLTNHQVHTLYKWADGCRDILAAGLAADGCLSHVSIAEDAASHLGFAITAANIKAVIDDLKIGLTHGHRLTALEALDIGQQLNDHEHRTATLEELEIGQQLNDHDHRLVALAALGTGEDTYYAATIDHGNRLDKASAAVEGLLRRITALEENAGT